MAAEHLAALDGGVVVMEIAVDASFCCGTFFPPPTSPPTMEGHSDLRSLHVVSLSH
jgi:hypothetical protein